jgi:hypothetical protein
LHRQMKVNKPKSIAEGSVEVLERPAKMFAGVG